MINFNFFSVILGWTLICVFLRLCPNCVQSLRLLLLSVVAMDINVHTFVWLKSFDVLLTPRRCIGQPPFVQAEKQMCA